MHISTKTLLATACGASNDVLMMSRKHCHARDVTSVVLDKTDGRLTRAFMVGPNHELYKNNPNNTKLSVGIHNHLYSIELIGVFGSPINYRYDYNFNHSAKEYNYYKFTSGVENGQPVVELLGKRSLRCYNGEVLLPDLSRHIFDFEFHTIYVPKGEVAVWLVKEGVTRNKYTYLFNNANINIDMSRYYQKFNCADDVLEFVNRFCMTFDK